MALKRSLRTTWWLFEASEEPRGSIFLNRFLFIVVPIIISLGLGSTLAQATDSIGLGIFAGIFVAVILYAVLSVVSDKAERRVKEYLNEEEPSKEKSVDEDLEYFKSYEIVGEGPVKPTFYQGKGEWICHGHIPPREFLDAVLKIDPYLSTIPHAELEDHLQYNYAVDIYSHRMKKNALKITDKSARGAYKITRLKAPYTFYPVHPPFLPETAAYSPPTTNQNLRITTTPIETDDDN